MAAETTTTISPPLPDAFLKFLNKNDIDPSIYHNSSNHSNPIPRYIRLKPQSSSGETEKALVSDIEKELKCKLEKVEWLLLCGFFSIPSHIQIAISKHYRQGNIYGIDAASGAAVIALDVSHGDHVLDLCAAPGAKLCMILDQLCGSGSLTGVDIARHRLAACRTMLQKYALGEWCRLFVADGTSFSLMPLRPQCGLIPCNESGTNCLKCTGEFVKEETENVFQEWASKRPWKERKRASKRNSVSALSLVPENQEPELIFYGKHSGVVGLSKSKLFGVALGSESSTTGYDKVLVDAECTHDGSIRHILKFEQWGWTTLQRRVLDTQRIDTLSHLQLQLLTNGFRLLKVGGSLVYSTCSLTVAQNEDVVELFLSGNPAAELQEIDAAKNWPCRSGRLPKTWRFDPVTSKTSGLFIAKLNKLAA